MKKLLLPAFVVVLVFCLSIARNSAGTTELNQDQNTKRQTEKQFLNPNDRYSSYLKVTKYFSLKPHLKLNAESDDNCVELVFDFYAEVFGSV